MQEEERQEEEKVWVPREKIIFAQEKKFEEVVNRTADGWTKLTETEVWRSN